MTSVQPRLVPYSGHHPIPARCNDLTTREADWVWPVILKRVQDVYAFDLGRTTFSGYESVDLADECLHVAVRVDGEIVGDLTMKCTVSGYLTVDLEDKSAFNDPFREMAGVWLRTRGFPADYPCYLDVAVDGDRVDMECNPL